MIRDVHSLELVGRIWIMETRGQAAKAWSFFDRWYARVSQYLANQGHGLSFVDDVMDDGTPYLALIWTKGCPDTVLALTEDVLTHFFDVKEYGDKDGAQELIADIIQELKQSLIAEQRAEYN